MFQTPKTLTEPSARLRGTGASFFLTNSKTPNLSRVIYAPEASWEHPKAVAEVARRDNNYTAEFVSALVVV